MKKWGIILILCLCFTFIKIEQFFGPKVKIQHYTQNEYEKIEDRWVSEDIQKTVITEELIHQGNLLLVNSEYPVHLESIKTDVINLFTHNELVKGYGLLNSEIYLSEEIALRFSEMIADAGKEGVNHFFINSGFRDFEKQGELYQQMGAAYALPAGYSEHNLGLSLDVGTTQMKMADAPEGKWIENNAWKYGFILRYPKDKTDITGIQYEPWHIRYVGLPHSAIMKEKNFVLEEYLDYLKDEKHISAHVNGKKYTITYYPISENRTINVPDSNNYTISGNNMDGVIVTIFE